VLRFDSKEDGVDEQQQKRQNIYNRLYYKAVKRRRAVSKKQQNIGQLRTRLYNMGFDRAATLPDSDILRIAVEERKLQRRLLVARETALYFAVKNFQKR
jgi:hypothetical protein